MGEDAMERERRFPTRPRDQRATEAARRRVAENLILNFWPESEPSIEDRKKSTDE